MARKKHSIQQSLNDQDVAGNGLLHRRLFLQGGAAMALSGYAANDITEAAEGLPVEPWMRFPTTEGFAPYGSPSRFEKHVVRTGMQQQANAPPGLGSIRTPLHRLDGTITPNGLHFVRLHSGVPDIDPDKHRLLIHGLVDRPLIFTLDTLAKYPMESRIYFLECGGNSQTLYLRKPIQAGVQRIHGQICTSDWTGVRLSTLLDETGVKPNAKWIVAEGADASGMARSVPLSKIMDDAFIALYQNGERLRPENGYPMRLFLPGYQGNAQVKYLRRIKVTEGPTHTRDETSRYSIARHDGTTLQFFLVMEAKSVITQPAPELKLQGPGYYKISGLAWSGRGRGIVRKVEVSADGGKSWAEAAIQSQILPKATVRFHMPWRWDGRPAILQSRCTDDTGYVQWTRDAMIAERGHTGNYHTNCITSWAVNEKGEVSHVYA
jgi:sulfane dehydrogenase subunit SoxC